MKKNKALILISLLMLNTTVPTFAIDKDIQQNNTQIEKQANTENKGNKDITQDKVLELTMEEAINIGLSNSLILDKVIKEIDLANVSKRRARFSTRKLEDGKKDIRDGRSQLKEVENLLEQGIIPKDITLETGDTIPAGTDISSLPEEIQDRVEKGIKDTISESRHKLDQGDLKIINSLQEAGGNISNQLDFASLDSLSIDGTKDVLNTMAEVSLEVTQASFDMYKNNIALLIRNNYYDVIQAEELLKVRERAMKRGKTQYEFSKASYEEGMKSKDDVLIASIYYKGTKIEYEQAKGNLENALIELKKSINIPLDRDIKLKLVTIEKQEKMDLNADLIHGMKNRLEVKKALGEYIVYDLNFTETKRKYPSNTFQYQEAELLKENTEIGFEQTKLEVENSIRQSYNSLNTISFVLEHTEDMCKEAQENLEIAEYRYKEGFGIETSLLRNLNLEDSAGTIIEVLAAEEKLVEIEEKIVEINHLYNLAYMKHLNNTGKYIY